MSLTPEARQRIYEEEKARLEAQERAKAEIEARKAEAKAKEEAEKARAKAEKERRDRKQSYLGGLILLGGIVFIVLGSHFFSRPSAPPVQSTPAQLSPAARAWANLDQAEHEITEFQKTGDLRGHFDAAKSHLDAVIVADLTPQDRTRYQQARATIEKILLMWRIDYAGQLDKALVYAGIDARVTVEGPEKRTVRMTYLLWSRPLLVRLQENGVLSLQHMKDLGFTRLIADTGGNGTYTFDLTRE